MALAGGFSQTRPDAALWNLAGRQRPRQIEPLPRSAVAAGVETPDWQIAFRDALGLRIDDAVAGVDEEDFAHDHFALGTELDATLDAALEGGGGFGDAGVLYHRRGDRGDAGLGELAFGF